MRYIKTLFFIAFLSSLNAQEIKLSATEELKVTVSEWVETMRLIQEEENEWTRDQEVLQNYREGLEKEIIELKENIAAAKTRKAGSDTESLKQTEERDRYVAAKKELSELVRGLEKKMESKLVLIPAPLQAEPKVAQAIEDLQRDIKLPTEKQDEGISKRLLNLISLSSEIEKFQQTVVLRQELHKDAKGNEYNMQVVYFGLAVAYAVNEDGTLALVGSPKEKEGWVFTERKDLAGKIQDLIGATTGDLEAKFVYLPFFQP